MFSGVPPCSHFAVSQLSGTFGLPRPGGRLSAGGFSCWEVLVRWEVKRFVEKCQLC